MQNNSDLAQSKDNETDSANKIDGKSILNAIAKKERIDREEPLIYAMKNGIKIPDFTKRKDLDPLLYALTIMGYGKSKTALEYAKNNDYQIEVDGTKYSFSVFEANVISSLKNDHPSFGKLHSSFGKLDIKQLQEIATNADFKIGEKSALLYILTKAYDPTQLIKNYLKKQDNKEQHQALYQEMVGNYQDNHAIIEKFAEEFNNSTRDAEDFIGIIDKSIDNDINVSDTVKDVIIKSKIKDKTMNFGETDYRKYGDRLLIVLVNEYLNLGEGYEKEDLKNKYEVLKEVMKLRCEDDSELTKFVSDPDECAKKLNDLMKKVHKIELGTTESKQVDLARLYKSYDLKTLDKLNQVGKKLKKDGDGQEEEEEKVAKKSSSALKNIGIVLAVITVLPAIILGITRLVSNYQAKKIFNQQREEKILNQQREEEILNRQRAEIDKVRSEIERLGIEISVSGKQGGVHSFVAELERERLGRMGVMR